MQTAHLMPKRLHLQAVAKLREKEIEESALVLAQLLAKSAKMTKFPQKMRILIHKIFWLKKDSA